MENLKLKNDKYRKVRGRYSRILKIYCSNCQNYLLLYQKDGRPTSLKRLYLDRIFEPKLDSLADLQCPKCKALIGTPFIYKKESRKAFLLKPGSFIKKVVRLKK